MKKDFSQNFQVEKLHSELIIRDSVSKKYLLFTSTYEHEEDFCNTLTLDLETSSPISNQLAKYLYENNLILNSFRELARENNVSFSFIDETPGTESSTICLLVEVDVIDLAKLDDEDSTASFVNIYDFLAKLSAGPYFGITTDLGIAQLISEDKALNNYHNQRSNLVQ